MKFEKPKAPKKKAPKKSSGQYWTAERLQYFSSGCSVLDLSLGGGWVRSRIINVVGDKSTGKTLLAIEAAANFIRESKNGLVRILDAEAAFDPKYAETVGLPTRSTEFAAKDDDEPIDTVEDFYDDLLSTLEKNPNRDVFYVLDSLDALTDRAEVKRDLSEGTYGASKAKMMSQIFRRIARRLKNSRVTLFVISQIRDKMDVSFGKKWTRSGGKALDFWAYQVVELQHLGRLKKTRKKVERAYGVKIKSLVSKNKLGPPFRIAEFPIHFGYGVEDLVATLQFLMTVGAASQVEGISSKEEAQKILKRIDRIDDDEYDSLVVSSSKVLREKWNEIEEDFRPSRSKYR